MGMVIDNVPYDRDIFQGGIAAHAVLQEVANKGAAEIHDIVTVAGATVEELITKGRAFQGREEPPMAPSDAFRGSDVAVDYLMWNPLPDALITVEGGYGMDSSGDGCEYYDDKCRYRAVIDLVYEDFVGDEDYAASALVVRDYKTAWPTGEAELDTLQRKGQAVLALKQHDDDYDIIRQEAVNLQTGRSFTRDIRLDEEGRELLWKWEQEIQMVCNAADQTRDARPGAGCLSCPFVLSCDDALTAYAGDADEVALQYAMAESIRNNLAKILRARSKDEPIVIEGGFVGYQKKVKRVPVDNIHQLLADQWTMGDSEEHPLMKGLLKAEKLTAANVENVLKALYPGRGKDGKDNMLLRKALLEEWLTDKAESRFGVFK